VRGFVPLCAALATVPVIVAAAHAVDAGWVPSSDDGMIALRSFDVLSSHPPLVGQYSQTSPLIHQAVYALGPLLYWLLSVPAHLVPRSMPIVIAAVNTACLAGSVVLADRRGGRVLALATALGLILATRALPVEAGYEPWNNWAGLFPFAFLLFLAWSVGCGEYRLLPLLGVVATFVLQVHLVYLAPGLAVTALAIGGLVLERQRRQMPHLGRWALIALALAVVCWSPPLVQQATHRPGNLTLAYRLATNHDTIGLDAGLRTATRAIGVPPWWAERVRHFNERILEPAYDRSAAGIATAILVVVAAVALLVLAWRRRRHDLVIALALALAMVFCIVVVTAALPTGALGYIALSYTLEWTVLAGMWVWLAVVWSALALVGLGARLPRAAAAAGLGAAALAALLVAAGRDYDTVERLPPGTKDYRLITSTTAQIVASLSGSRSVYIDVSAGVRHSLALQSAIAFTLRREGFRIGVPPGLSREMGDHYEPGGGPFDQVLVLRNPTDPPVPGSTPVLRNRVLSVMLKPWTPSHSRSSAP
jgi:hypothetical protein